jgi:multidrug efflux pump subunit AcrB
MAHQTDDHRIRRTRNTARFFVENRHVAWVLLALTLLWGVWGYLEMPKRKDPVIPIRIGAVVCPWPGQPAQRVEERVTRRLEEKIAENGNVERVFSTTRNSVAVMVIVLDARIDDVGKELDDIQGKLDQVHDLPEGAGPIQFLKDFRDASALMLTVASPVVPPVEISIRADALRRALLESRADATAAGRAALVVSFPYTLEPGELDRLLAAFPEHLRQAGLSDDARILRRPGFLAVDAAFPGTDARFLEAYRDFVQHRMSRADLHPDVWEPAVVRDLAQAEARLSAVAGPRYTYRDLDDFTERISRTLSDVPQVSKAVPVGVLPEAVYLNWDPERLAAHGLQPSALPTILQARNTPVPGGILESGDRNVLVEPSGEFRSEEDLGGVMVGASPAGAPLYLRDLFEIRREYVSPPRYLNFYNFRDAEGHWRRTRAVTLSVLMKPGNQIADFGTSVDAALERVKAELPDDLVIARTSDQPLQVRENVDLFMRSLWEAVLLIVVVAFLGFREWRSATVMALSIPLTLAMTFGMMRLVGLDIQQVSIASLIIALGLLVDDPVVAGDAIKRDLAAGHPPAVAAWLGPTKLANAIVFATLTNIAAYLPLLLMKEDIARFIYSLPVVVTCSLVASRIVSMTFVPLLGVHLLRAADGGVDPRSGRLGRVYRAVVGWAIDHRWKVALAMTVLLAATGFVGSRLKTSFFPTDLSYLFYVDVWTPEDSSLSATGEAARRAEDVVRETAAAYAKDHPGEGGAGRDVLRSVTTFVGGGGPRFWISILPEMQQLNYAQLVIQMEDKYDTEAFVGPLQAALSAGVPGALIDVRRLETAKPVGIPVSIRLTGDDIPTLRAAGERLKAILRDVPIAERVRDDWGAETLALRLDVDPDRANLSGLTNLDVALSSVSGVNGFQVATLADGRRTIPVSIRLRPEARADLSDLSDFTVYSVRSAQRVPIRSVATPSLVMEPEKIKHRAQFRTLTVSAFPVAGVLPSEVLKAIRPRLDEVRATLPPGHRLEIGGEEEEQVKAFRQISVVMAISVLLIYLMLTLEFRHAAKPLIVFAAIPFGLVGALVSLWIAGAPFGFMAFLGVASLIGVIVSHVIVLFDFIEVLHEGGATLREALADAGIVRLRPVLITVGATVLGLFPLALHGGPLWEPLCWAQIGGLSIATVITLLIVPVIYAIFVLDLKIVRWGPGGPTGR